MSPIVDGKDLSIMFELMSRCSNDVNKLMLDGISPLISFAAISNFVRLPKLPIENGRMPVSDSDRRLISVMLA